MQKQIVLVMMLSVACSKNSGEVRGTISSPTAVTSAARSCVQSGGLNAVGTQKTLPKTSVCRFVRSEDSRVVPRDFEFQPKVRVQGALNRPVTFDVRVGLKAEGERALNLVPVAVGQRLVESVQVQCGEPIRKYFARSSLVMQLRFGLQDDRVPKATLGTQIPTPAVTKGQTQPQPAQVPQVGTLAVNDDVDLTLGLVAVDSDQLELTEDRVNHSISLRNGTTPEFCHQILQRVLEAIGQTKGRSCSEMLSVSPETSKTSGVQTEEASEAKTLESGRMTRDQIVEVLEPHCKGIESKLPKKI